MAGTLIGRLMVGLGLDSSGLDTGTKKATKKLSFLQRQTKAVSSGIVRSMGAMGAAFAIGSVVTNTARTVSNFDQKVANLAATSGKARSQMGSLVDNAKNVGAVSAFSASQVLDLQTELAKLGNSEKEIISMTKSVGDFSLAVGATAADAAILAGGVLKSFGKNASETESVVSSLAVATTKSALDFNKLNTALPLVGTAADQSGVSLERTVSLLGVLSDRNIDASTSGTALRNIFLDLKDKGLTYEEAMAQINGSTDKLNEANKLFGKRGAVVATVLAESSNQADILEKSITGVDGALKKMTDERLNTLQGQLTLLSSAWEGFILSVENGDGVISSAFKNIVGAFSGVITGLTGLNKGASFDQFLILTYGTDTERQAVLNDLKEAKQIQEDIASGARNQSGGYRAQRGGGLGGLRNKQVGDSGLNEEIKKLGNDTKKAIEPIKTLSQEISEHEAKILTLSEAYIKGGSSNESFTEKIKGHQAEIFKLNGDLANSIALVKELNSPYTRTSITSPTSLTTPDSGGVSGAPEQIKISNEYIQSSKEYTEGLTTANYGLAESYTELGNAMGNALASGANSFGEFASTALKSIQQVIAAELQRFVATSIANSAIGSGPFGWLIAPVVGGLAAGIFNTAINSLTVPKLADGGVITGPTFAMLGEYPGASTNPEIAAPESKLRDIFSGELRKNGSNGRMFSVTKGSDIYTSQDRYNYRLTRTG